MSHTFIYISFKIKCEGEWVSGMWGPLPKMEKLKDDKFLGTNEKGNKWQIFKDGGTIMLLNVNLSRHFAKLDWLDNNIIRD